MQKRVQMNAKYSKNAEKLPNIYICKKLTSGCYTMLAFRLCWCLMIKKYFSKSSI